MASNVICHVLRGRTYACHLWKINYFMRQVSDIVKKLEENEETIQRPSKEPFMKNVFMGKFDTDLLAFPEVLGPDQVKSLERNLSLVNQVLKGKDAYSQSLPIKEMIDQLRRLGVFGLQVTRMYGGLDLRATEYARYTEVLSQNLPILLAVTTHQAFGAKALLMAGSKAQRRKYAPLLASGQRSAAFCLFELSHGADATTVETEARMSNDGKEWLISGSKILICDKEIPDLMTTIAKTGVDETAVKRRDVLSVFLVQKTNPGISVEKKLDILGDRSVNLYEVTFEKTPVPVENVLGKLGDGVSLSSRILNSNRFNAGSVCAGILKNVLKRTAEICHKELGGDAMYLELHREKIAKMACSIYTMESMTYVTAGLLDMYDNPDTIVEGAIVKVFSSEELVKNIIECQTLLGTYKFFEEDLLRRALKTSEVYSLLEGSNSVLRILIAISGLQHAGLEQIDAATKLRSPFMRPGYVFKKIFERRNHARDDPKLALRLEDYLHPSLKEAAKHLEFCVLKLQYAAELVHLRHGNKVEKKESDLNRLADIAIGIYAMTSVLARASRSYTIGLPNSECELQMALTICYNTYSMVREDIVKIEKAELVDNRYREISKEVIKNKNYCIENSLFGTLD